MRRGAKPTKAKVKGKRPAARKSLKNEDSRVRDLEKRLTGALQQQTATAEVLQTRTRELNEALEQQTATAEILRVISSSPTNLRPVLETIAENAARVCGATDAVVHMVEGGELPIVAHYGLIGGTEGAPVQRFPLTRGSVVGRAVIDARAVHVEDAAASDEAEFPLARQIARQTGHRTVLATPLLREGVAIGALVIRRTEVRPFTERQIALLQTFADQAVIAIENVRLFKELEARNRDLTVALDQQTATSDILKVISSSPTDVQPVFDAIVRAVVRLCHAVQSNVQLFDGQLMHFVAQHNIGPVAMEMIQRVYPMPPNRNQTASRAILDRTVVHVPDVLEDPEYLRELAVQGGWRSVLSVPMIGKGQPIGAITVTRMEPGWFSETEIGLLQTFADQAVIAIENVRLFTELEQKNEAVTQAHAHVTEALEQQTATAEILRVISRSQTDVQPVFDTIVRSAVRLCDGLFSALYQFDGEVLRQVAQHNFTPEALEEVGRISPVRPTRALGGGRAILEHAVVHIPDVETDPEYPDKAVSRAIGFRSGLFVPMLREGAPIGVIMVARAEPGPFAESEIELLKTFADQAVIAVENVRLFKELEARTTALTRSVGELQALGEVSQAVSSTLDLQTVLTTIVARAAQLSGADAGSIYEYDEATQELSRRAVHNMEAEILARPDQRFRRGEGALGQAVERREPVQYADISDSTLYDSKVRDLLLRFGYRALLAVPLLREDQIIGALVVNRKTPGEFPPETVELLTTFATQSALAIQNARLFREIADKSAQLEAASRHKSEFLANMSHELRTPLNAIIGFSEVLTERMFGELNEKQEEYLKDIYASGQHLLSLINDILDLSKIEAGRMELEVTDFDLPSAIDNALILVRERASRRGITLGHSIDERLGAIRGDERKVKQVLLNLLSNALKFTPEGGRIDVRAAPRDGLAEISVADTGVGIAPEDQEAVFEEFRQVGTADKKVEGTGLGLALSRKFIELHGGRIWVESEVGKGSTFRFTLPST